MSTTTDQTRERLRGDLAALGAERARLRQQQAGLRQQIRYAVIDADEAGLTITEIAQLTCMTRRAVYDLLDQ